VSDAPAAPAGAGRRLSLVTVDQALSSGSNLVVTVLAAHTLPVSTFGVFAIVFLTYVTAQGLVRALIGEPLLVHPIEVRERTTEVVGTGVWAGALAALVCAALAGLLRLLDVGAAPAFGVLALCLPLLFVQDLGRYLAFTLHRPARALVLDGAWLALVVATTAALLLADVHGLTPFVAAWAGSGALAGSIVLVQYRVRGARRSTAWLRQTWTFSWRYALSYASMQSAALGVSLALIAVADAEALAAVRGAWLLLGIYVQLQAAAMAAGVAEVSRIARWGWGVDRHVRRTTGLTTGVALVNAAVLLVLPDALGRVALGDTWAVAEPLLVPAGVVMVTLGLVSGVRSALLGLRLVRVTFAVDVSTTAVTFGATVVGAVVDAAYGAFWFLAVSQAAAAATWWTVFVRLRARAGAEVVVSEQETIPAC
jgi:O-antigen/teichoic acid export membrane protein